MPERNIKRWLTITASAGTSRRVGIKVWENFMSRDYTGSREK
jgi:hypothetical protein